MDLSAKNRGYNKLQSFRLDKFIGAIVENKYLQIVTTVFAIISAVGITLGYSLIFWASFAVFIIGLFYAGFQEYGKFKVYRRDFIPIPIVINVANPADSKNAIGRVFSLIGDDSSEYKHHKENLEQMFHIKDDDLIFEFKGDIENKEKLKDFLKISRHDIEKLEHKIPAKDEFYIIYIGPVSVAILVGAIFANSAIMVLQYDKSANGYNKIYEIKDRTIKENVESLVKFDLKTSIQNQGTNKKATLAVDISSHKINLDQSQIKNYGDIFYLKAKNNSGTLGMDEDWGQYVREIFKELNELQIKYEEVKLVYSMPISIGLMLGVAIHNYWKIMLTQYEDGVYKDLMYTNEIKYHF